MTNRDSFSVARRRLLACAVTATALGDAPSRASMLVSMERRTWSSMPEARQAPTATLEAASAQWEQRAARLAEAPAGQRGAVPAAGQPVGSRAGGAPALGGTEPLAAVERARTVVLARPGARATAEVEASRPVQEGWRPAGAQAPAQAE